MSSRSIDRRAAEMSVAYVLTAFLFFGVAALAGLLQGLVRGGVITLPKWVNYYQLLTAHGVLMALVFTTFFILGFFYAGMAKTITLPRVSTNLGWIGWAMMFFGTTMATATILIGDASVMYTFYAPLKASPWFYIGATLLIVGSWVTGAGMIYAYTKWRKANQGQLSPLFAFMAVATMVLWYIATLGVAAEVLLQLIPWSFGWVPTVNVVLSRMLFWFFGHPLVYFWLMPAYAAWYNCVPKIVGAKIFSDSLARLTFVLFILLSIPVGFHHQLTEAGISEKWKIVHVALTLGVVLPSMMTAFSMFATFETVGREKGSRRLFGYFKKLPWGDVRFFAPFIGMVMFIPAGIGGIINTSNQLNQVIHNTIWVTGHFHLTVATSVALTFFGVSYWLIPSLMGRKLTKRIHKLGIFQTILWTVGMLIMSGAMHFMGLLGVPRRTDYTTYMDDLIGLSWMKYETLMAIGGALLFVAAMLMVGIVIYLWKYAPVGEEEFPMADSQPMLQHTPRVLEKWKLWIALTALLILISYGYPVYDAIVHAPPGAPPMKTW
ncbi:b(o/a)3-type cytochrome-c oxidase subunit 1 [Tumebacillus sp. ITR2]|uniref:B(O/a)3-type cytochrome-c oxidase subunit 1 n=1 Tax=Tumebacillus amylolyticus TaxID=2801339 RepID=A0ABS1JFA9_9BACL|nr:b(o/a)3-type cytochrome-c oxidase subunit 1 [Tumebacillus amylolyticus]MBL0388684.1 b(o/a)3-type cytochrome-c oxidase subunit 1 [Tumebacillus amylolyticus]